MADLFRVETDRVMLLWSVPLGRAPQPLSGIVPPVGRLKVSARRARANLKVMRTDVPDSLEWSTQVQIGPRLYEQTDYPVYVQAAQPHAVELRSPDPSLTRGLRSADGGAVQYGVINFRQQVGHATFTVSVDGLPELDFEVEVFPTKLDYVADYEQIVAELRDILSGLVLEYLRATHQLGPPDRVSRPTYLEWFMLLQYVMDDLDLALRQIARRPQWAMERTAEPTRAERVRHVDSAVRRAVLRGARSAQPIPRSGRLSISQRVDEQRARPTLDTPEHRWLATQLTRILQTLADIRRVESHRDRTPRQAEILSHIDDLVARVTRMQKLAPLAEANGAPPPNFASLQLVAGPGYREAYKACLMLLMGLRLTGGPVNLSLKDIDELYEYWVFLKVLQAVGDQLGQPIPVQDLLRVENQGLRVQLQRGRERSVTFARQNGRKIIATYNPQYRGQGYLIPQQPDIVLTLEEADWAAARMVIDAKYRVDASAEYLKRYAVPGPPDDALNVLHRYRDAILADDHSTGTRPSKDVVEAVALFPFREREPGEFGKGRHWTALNQIGVGAIPLLPNQTEYLEEWVRGMLAAGGWTLSDRVVPHLLTEEAFRWREAASVPVLIGPLHRGAEQQHLDWTLSTGLYYAPLRPSQPRQFIARYVAIYSPTALRRPGAVEYVGEVESVEACRRRDIDTPWQPRGDPGQITVLYRLRDVTRRSHPIENVGDRISGSRFSTVRWSSRLGLERARRISELLLETEPEWRLLEALHVQGTAFTLQADRPTRQERDNPAGRVWFRFPGLRVRYGGLDGFLFLSDTDQRYWVPTPERAAAEIAKAAA